MGVQSRLIGYIEEAWPGASANGDVKQMQKLRDTDCEIIRHNETVLNELPIEDKWPPLCRHMFGWAPTKTPMIIYKNRLIHFAASLKEMDWALRDWLDKFELLLRQLYWESAFVRFEGAYLGDFEFTWLPNRSWVEQLCDAKLSPITEWSFSSTMPLDDLAGLRE